MSIYDVNNLNFRLGKAEEKNIYDEFALEEYKNISQAHYNTNVSISNFFKHYLIIVSIPLTIISISEKYLGRTNSNYLILIAITALLISAVGFLVCLYVMNLRFDAILYARAVNGIRNYFIERGKLPHYQENMYRVLPRNKELPAFFEGRYFFVVIITFAFINTYSFFIGGYNLIEYYRCYNTYICCYLLIVCPLLFILVHVLIYVAMVEYRENNYLKSRIIGIDIDGVLNKHREHFCRILKEEEAGPEINPDKIDKIPVHECNNFNLSNSDEKKVFHNIKYWNNMPISDDAPYYVNKIRNVLQYKVYIYTFRSWPDFSSLKGNIDKYKKQWGYRCWLMRKLFPRRKIKQLTRKWLKKYKIRYNKFFLEWNTDNKVCTGKKNRYTLCKKKKIGVFVEDQTENAIRLSAMCNVVFLIKHPYNKEIIDKGSLPSNIIPVDNWKDIYHYMRNYL